MPSMGEDRWGLALEYSFSSGRIEKKKSERGGGGGGGGGVAGNRGGGER